LKEIEGARDEDNSCIGDEELDRAIREGMFCGNGVGLVGRSGFGFGDGEWVDRRGFRIGRVSVVLKDFGRKGKRERRTSI